MKESYNKLAELCISDEKLFLKLKPDFVNKIINNVDEKKIELLLSTYPDYDYQNIDCIVNKINYPTLVNILINNNAPKLLTLIGKNINNIIKGLPTELVKALVVNYPNFLFWDYQILIKVVGYEFIAKNCLMNNDRVIESIPVKIADEIINNISLPLLKCLMIMNPDAKWSYEKLSKIVDCSFVKMFPNDEWNHGDIVNNF
jgi:hypothetical protein